MPQGRTRRDRLSLEASEGGPCCDLLGKWASMKAKHTAHMFDFVIVSNYSSQGEKLSFWHKAW